MMGHLPGYDQKATGIEKIPKHTCSLRKATLQESSLGGFEPLLLAPVVPFIILEAEEEVPFEIRRL